MNIMSFSAESYERTMVPALFAPWASRLIQSADPRPGERVLDVACGTGIVVRSVAPRVGPNGTVAGLDLNPDMLAVARTTAQQMDLAIEWKAGRAEQLPFPDASFDLVVCQFGLMLFSDRGAALAEMQRVLVKGGRVVLSVWQGMDRHPFHRTLHEISRRRIGVSGVQGMFALGDVGELRRLLMDAGFRDVHIEPASITARFPNPEEFLAWEMDVDPHAIPSLQSLDAPARRASMASIREDMSMALHEVMQDNHVVIPFHAHIARARR